ncbi:MAG: hypothetical protein JWN27_3605 [Candidatus Eremiobacteraeota bacterium]|nr:hypothetical protein [Candidatus Eremiobacteraeota bacterium]
MVNRAFPPRRDRTAIVLSIALHCCVLAFAATIVMPTFSPDVQDERSLLTGIIRIEHRTPPRVAHVRPATLPSPVARARPVDRPVLRVARSVSRAARVLVVPAERRFRGRSPEAPAKAARPSAPAPVVVAAAAAHPLAAATAMPTPLATATPAPVAVAREAGIGNFGEDYPAKVDPQSRSGLFAGINDAVQLRVTVDESGHVVTIEFVRAPSDPAMVQELRNRLLAARFIPAVCNGLRCAGTVPLHN